MGGICHTVRYSSYEYEYGTGSSEVQGRPEGGTQTVLSDCQCRDPAVPDTGLIRIRTVQRRGRSKPRQGAGHAEQAWRPTSSRQGGRHSDAEASKEGAVTVGIWLLCRTARLPPGQAELTSEQDRESRASRGGSRSDRAAAESPPTRPPSFSFCWAALITGTCTGAPAGPPATTTGSGVPTATGWA